MVTGFRHYAFTRLSQPLAEKIAAVLLVAGFAIIGSLLIVNTKATTPTASKEAESGTITAPATLVNDTSASGSKAVRFNPASTGGGGGTGVSSTTPCNHSPAPAQWKHVVVLIFENKTYSNVIGNVSAPWISQLATKCGTYANWYDANFKVTGASDGSYASKPNYATMTSGVPPTVHGLTNDTYTATSGVDNIFNRLRLAGISTKSYESGTGGSCAVGNFSGSYHDPMRYYTNLGGQSSSPTTFCNTHDVPIANFMTDVNSGNLPAYSFILPTNDQNMHNNSVSSGDAWAQSFLKPFLDSTQYKSGDTALFFLWDEDRPIPDVLVAPSIVPGSHPTTTGYPISHFSALRTWQEMLGLPTPLVGDSGQAPSLLNYYNGH